jgi:hypothetical protein
MQVFIMHVGSPGNVDIKYTIMRRRSVQELMGRLPLESPERSFFEDDPIFLAAFPTKDFNCWGVPSGAEPSFEKTEIGDLVLIAPSIGSEGGITQIGIVKAKCPIQYYEASRILWPDTPNDRLFPLIFFFDTEIGFRSWYQFIDDVGYQEHWNPRGWYRPIVSSRFEKWDGSAGYLAFLREQCGFTPIPQVSNLAKPEGVTRTLSTISRIVRDTPLANKIKALHGFKCQICGTALQLSGHNLYAESHHIQPLGVPHNGPDIEGNILCVCPNHHTQLDYGAIKLNKKDLQFVPGHQLRDEYINYHNTVVFGG